MADFVADNLQVPLSDVENQLWKFLHRFIITGELKQRRSGPMGLLVSI